MTGRLPGWAAASLALHAGLLAAFGFLARQTPARARQVAVGGVEILIRAPAPRASAGAAPKPLSTFDFLKLALPSAARATAPAALDAKIPAPRRAAPVAMPKLEELVRRDLPKLEALDLSRERAVSAAALKTRVEIRRRAAATLAALPRLEDVGRRRVRDLPQALTLEERRQEAVSLQGLGDAVPKPPGRREALAAAEALKDAAPASPEPPRRGLAAILPRRDADLSYRAAPAPAFAPLAAAPKLERRQAAAVDASKPKGVEIAGPLAGRRVVASVVPPFPAWARAQGVLEAAVAIRFSVDPSGAVLPEMSVERTSGSGRLDRLAMDALQGWRFEPLGGVGAQWGVITFRFLLE
ncbi:MAG: energy transducer TonB [Elusimicrobia bacterium]|nr:energy transducer TonB [Elusimicrobiota bacterium]